MTVEEFLDFLAQRQLVSANVLRQLREKAARDDHQITPRSILKFLVQKNFISSAHAKELLQTVLTVDPKTESSILGLALLPKPSFPLLPESPPSHRVESQGSDEEEGLSLVADSDLDLPAPARFDDERRADVGDDAASSEEGWLNPEGSVLSGEASLDAPPFDERTLVGEASEKGLTDAAALGGRSPADSWNEPSDLEGAKTRTGRASKKSNAKRKSAKKKSAKKKSEWDSPLLLLGGGGLVLLLAVGALLYFLLFREQADDVLKLASDSFDSGAYSRAIDAYERFVDDFPSHPDHSKARVRLGMTRLWQATEGTRDFGAALETAKQTISHIEDEPAFATDGDDEQRLSQAKNELSSLLTRIAKGLSEQAETSDDPQTAQQLVEQTEQALVLTRNTKYVPQRFRQDTELDVVRETLDRIAARREREAQLASTLQQMDQAVADGDVSKAFSAHKQLLDRFAILRDSESLAAKVREIADRERSVIQFVPQTQPARTDPIPSPIVASVAFAQTTGQPIAAATGVVAIQIDGSLYGVRVADGTLVWRRFLGRDSDVLPVAVGDQHLVTVDAAHDELVAVRRDDGRLLWRNPLGERLAQPALVGGRLLVASERGKLFVLDPLSGDLQGFVQFSQPLSAAVAGDDHGNQIYAVGRQSNIYALSQKDLSCEGVYYFGHDRHSIAAPPLVVLNKLVVAENLGAQTSQLRVLALDEQGVPTRQVADARLDGLIVTPLLSAQRRLTAITTRGAVGVFEIGAGDDETALAMLASREASPGSLQARFGAMSSDGKESTLWIAGGELTKLAILPTDNRLPARSLDNTFDGDAFDHPLQIVDGALIHVRRPAEQAGVYVGAVELAESRSRWQTRLAVSAAGEPAVDGTGARIAVALASGDVFQPDRQALSRRIDSNPLTAPRSAKNGANLSTSLDLGEGSLLVAAPESAQLILAPLGGKPQRIDLASHVSCRPVRWGEGVAVATSAGQIHLLDAADGHPLAEPFQPRLAPGETTPWLEPAVTTSASGALLVATVGVGEIFALQVEASPTPHLVAALQSTLAEATLTTRLAAAGDKIFAGDDQGGVLLFLQENLAFAGRADLGGAVAWGPFPVGDAVIVGLDSGETALVDADGAIVWRIASTTSVPVGTPLVEEETIWVAYRDGTILPIAWATGKAGKGVALAEWVSTGPVRFGRLLTVAGADGALLFFNRP